MTLRLIERLNRLEARPAPKGEAIPPGMIPVLMWSVATRLGGFPRPAEAGSARTDEVSDGFARGLGYGDFEEMDRIAGEDPETWSHRIQEGYTALLQSEGIDSGVADTTQVFAGFARLLDAAAAIKATHGDTPGWTDMTERLEDWARTYGLSMFSIRTEARA